MSNYQGHCHCGNTQWTASLEKDQQAHVLWYVTSRYFKSAMLDF